MGFREISRVLIVLSLILATVLLQGCDDDTVCPKGDVGIVSVTSYPDSVSVPWTLTLPDGLMAAGIADTTLVLTTMGEYSISWGEIDGWVRVDTNATTIVLEDESAANFIAWFVEDDSVTGSFVVEQLNPDLGATWDVTGPNGFTASSDDGVVVFTQMEEGDYTITWNPVPLWITPSEETQTIEAGENVIFSGVYEIDLPVALTPTILMSNFKSVYENMFFEGYESILHDAHITNVLQSTFDDWEGSNNPLNFLYFDRFTIAQIHDNLFNGAMGHDEAGNPITPIDSISIAILERLGTWEAVPETMPYFGAFDCYTAIYSMLVHFNKPDGSRFEVSHNIEFIVTMDESEIWSLLGVIPHVPYGVISTEQVSYDAILSLYR